MKLWQEQNAAALRFTDLFKCTLSIGKVKLTIKQPAAAIVCQPWNRFIIAKTFALSPKTLKIVFILYKNSYHAFEVACKLTVRRKVQGLRRAIRKSAGVHLNHLLYDLFIAINGKLRYEPACMQILQHSMSKEYIICLFGVNGHVIEDKNVSVL